PEAGYAECAGLTGSYAGLGYDSLGAAGKIWPCRDPEQEEGTRVLFDEVFPTPTGKGRFVPCEFAPAKELPDAEYPLVLNTGRLLEHWHTGTMTRRAAALDALQPVPFVEVHPDDLERHGLRDGEMVTVRSRRGEIHLEARASRAVTAGSV